MSRRCWCRPGHETLIHRRQRTEQLLGRQFASQAEVDRARLALAQSESQLKSALAQLSIKGAQDDSVLVASGLQGGETVVTAGVHLLHAGQKVKTVGAVEAVATAR